MLRRLEAWPGGSCTRGPRSRGALSELLGSHQLLVGAAAVGGGRAGRWDEEAGDGAGASSPGSAFLFGAGGARAALAAGPGPPLVLLSPSQAGAIPSW